MSKLTSHRTGAISLLLAFLLLPVSSTADPGVLEINQACAVGNGCFPGDAPGFPVLITSAGSYRLTGNLDLTGESLNVSAISVATSQWLIVSLNLGGFEIVGPCASGSACVGNAQGGIGVFGVTNLNNGTVRNMARHGALVGTHAVVDRVSAADNGDVGIWTVGSSLLTNLIARDNGGRGIYLEGGGSVLRDCRTVSNGGHGIDLSLNCVVERCTADGNGASGIFAGELTSGVVIRDSSAGGNGNNGIHTQGRGASINGNTASRNTDFGIRSGEANSIHANTAVLNQGGGIFAQSGSTVTGNTAQNNGFDPFGAVLGEADGIFANGGSTVGDNTSRENTGHGISVNGPSRVYGNTSTGNTRRGLRMQSTVAYGQNVVAGNGEGDIESGLQMGENFCGTNLTCP